MVDWILLIGLLTAVVLQAIRFFRSPSSGDMTALKDFLYSLVLQAESMWGGGTGEAKRAYVVQAFYERAPDILKRLVKPEQLLALVEAAVARMKKYFSDNPAAEEKIGGAGNQTRK